MSSEGTRQAGGASMVPECSNHVRSVNSISSITRQEVAELQGDKATDATAQIRTRQEATENQGGDAIEATGGASSQENTVLQKLEKWANYESYGEPVQPTRFIPMKTPMSSEIINNWSLEEPPKHVLTISTLLEEEKAKGREIGLIIDLSNHETLYAEDLAAAPTVQYAHIQLVAKIFPGKASITQVIKTARTFWDQHPEHYIAIHCAYGFNRTGFVVCAYLILVCGLSVQEALGNFAAARPPGVKHEKFVVELYRRYGTRKTAPSHPIPVQQEAQAAPEALGKPGLQQRGSRGSLESNVAGRSPESDAGASQYSAASGSSRVVRLYPDEELMQPMEPGTPSTESTMATQQLWDALQRSRATAYRVRAASELSVAGSKMGGRCSEDDMGYSMDGRFSCSSLYSEFGHVASHLEERHPDLVLARTSMRPLPPRSVTSEVSTVSELPARRSLEDAPQLAAQGPRQGREPGSASSRQERQMAEAAADLAARLAGDSDQSSAGTSREATRHGQQQLSSWVESDAERPSEESRPAPSVPGHEQQAEEHLPPGTTIHTHLNGHHHPQGEEPSVQHSSNSNSSIGGGSACSLMNNESLGLDERGIFEQFNKRDRNGGGQVDTGQAASSDSRLTLKDIRAGAASDLPRAEACPDAANAGGVPAVHPDTPFADPTIQGTDSGGGAPATAAAESSKRGKVARRLFSKQTQREWRARCSLM